MSQAARSAHGFTLIELMTVVAVIAVLSAVAAPSFVSLIATQRLRNASFDMVSDLLLARSEALNRQSNVTFAPAATNGGEWTTGWLIEAPAGTTLTSRLGLAAAVRYVPVDSSGSALGSLTFGGTNGGRLTLTATPVRITVKSADLPAAKWSCITLDATGRAKVVAEKGACS